MYRIWSSSLSLQSRNSVQFNSTQFNSILLNSNRELYSLFLFLSFFASSSLFCSPRSAVCPLPSAAHADHNGLSPRQIKSDSDDDDLPNVTLDSVNETGSTALSIARAVQEWVPWAQVWAWARVWVWELRWRMSALTDYWHPTDLKKKRERERKDTTPLSISVAGSEGWSWWFFTFDLVMSTLLLLLNVFSLKRLANLLFAAFWVCLQKTLAEGVVDPVR